MILLMVGIVKFDARVMASLAPSVATSDESAWARMVLVYALPMLTLELVIDPLAAISGCVADDFVKLISLLKVMGLLTATTPYPFGLNVMF